MKSETEIREYEDGRIEVWTPEYRIVPRTIERRRKMDPNHLTVEEFIEQLDGRGFRATPNRNVIVIEE